MSLQVYKMVKGRTKKWLVHLQQKSRMRRMVKMYTAKLISVC